MNLAGLSNFTYSGASGTLVLSANSSATAAVTVTLPANAGSISNITVGTLAIAQTGTTTNNNVIESTLNIGQNTTIAANNIQTGSGHGSAGQIQFASNLINPILTLEGISGGVASATTRLTNVLEGQEAGGSSQGVDNINFSGGTVYGNIGTWDVGTVNNVAIQNDQGAWQASFAAGAIDVSTLSLNFFTGAPSLAGTDSSSGTFSQSGGTVIAGTLYVGQMNTNVTNGNSTNTINMAATYNLSGGTLAASSITDIFATTATGNVTNLDKISWTGGIIENFDPALGGHTALSGEVAGNLTIAGSTTNVTAGALSVVLGNGAAVGFFAESGKSITQGNNTSISGGNSSTVLSISGPGTVNLADANTYSGSTALNSGTLNLDFSQAYSPTSNILPSATLLSLNGGALKLSGKASTSNAQAVGNVTLGIGGSSIAMIPSGGSNPLLLTLGNITRSAGATIDFALSGTQSGTNGITTTSALTITNGILTSNGVAFATAGGSDWAITAGSGPSQIEGYSTFGGAGVYATGTGNYTSGNNVRVTNGDSVSGVTVNSLLINTASAGLTLAGNNTIGTGGILVSSAATGATISGGKLLNGNAGKELVIIDNGTLNISSTIADNGGASSLTLSGTGTITVSGANTYTGMTFISGNVAVGNSGAFGAGILNFGQGAAASLNLSGNLAVSSIAGGTSGGGSIVLASNILTVNGNSTNTSYGGVISGTGGLTKSGNGTLNLTGSTQAGGLASTYSGGTIVSGGLLNLTGTGDLGNGTVQINSGGVLEVSSSYGVVAVNSVTVASGGELQIGSNGSNGTYNLLAFPVNVTGTGVGGAGGIFFGNGNTNMFNLAGTVTLGGGTTIRTFGINNTVNLLGGISGTGPLTLSSDAANTASNSFQLGGTLNYSGTTTIAGQSAGETVKLLPGTAFPATTSLSFTFSGNGSVADSTTLDINGTNQTVAGLNGTSNASSLLTITNSGSAATLTVNTSSTSNSYGGVLTGSLGLVKSGSGTLNLTNASSTANTFTGGTVVSAGVLNVNSTGGLPLGTASTNLVTVADGAQLLFTNHGGGVPNIPNNFTLSGNGSGLGALSTFNSGNFQFTGNVTLAADTVMNFNPFGQSGITFSGVISGPGGLTIAATATGSSAVSTVLTNANTYGTGNTTGNLKTTLTSANNGSQAFTTELSTVTNVLPATTTVQFGGTPAGAAGTYNNNVTLLLDGISQTVAGLTTGVTSANTNGYTIQGNSGTLSTLIVNNGSADAFSGTLGSGTAGATNANNLALVKSNSGALSLSAASTYTGGTSVNAGTLRANNASGSATGTGNIAVAALAILGGNGTVSGAVTLASGNGTAETGGIITAGLDASTAGKLTTGAQTWNGGSTYLWKVQNAGTLGASAQTGGNSTTWDRVAVSGNVTVGSAGSPISVGANTPFTIQLSSLTGSQVGSPTPTGNFTTSGTYSWIIGTASTGVIINGTALSTSPAVVTPLSKTSGVSSSDAFALDTSGFNLGTPGNVLPSAHFSSLTQLAPAAETIWC